MPRARTAGGPSLRVVLKRDGRWWVATMRSFPGAYGQGRTQAAAVRSLASAIADLVETYAALKRHAPRRTSRRRTSRRLAA